MAWRCPGLGYDLVRAEEYLPPVLLTEAVEAGVEPAQTDEPRAEVFGDQRGCQARKSARTHRRRLNIHTKAVGR